MNSLSLTLKITLYLNKKLFTSGLKNSALCSSCNLSKEVTIHMFYKFNIVTFFWKKLKTYFDKNFRLTTLTPQTAILGIFDEKSIDN